MPAASQQKGPPAQRTTFRPPWVKEGPEPPPTSGAPWRRQSRDEQSASSSNVAPESRSQKPDNNSAKKSSTTKEVSSAKIPATNAAVSAPAPGRKQSKITIIPSTPSVSLAQSKENGIMPPKTPPPLPMAPPMPPPPPPSQAQKGNTI